MVKTKRAIALLSTFALLAPSAVFAQQDLFPQASSAAALRTAAGVVWDTSEQDADPHWTFDGEWLLRCAVGPCSSAPLQTIGFDLALTMVRPDGVASHSHAFTNFRATNVQVLGNDLIIDGMIDGTGAVGPGLITITLSQPQPGGDTTVFVEFPGNVHVVGPIGGVIVRSG